MNYKRMSSECGTAEGSVDVSESNIPVELEKEKCVVAFLWAIEL